MAKKIELELFRYDTLVFGKLVHLDDSLKCSEDNDFERVIYDANDFKIIASDTSELALEYLQLEGEEDSSTSMEISVFERNCGCVEQAITICNHIVEAINAINGEGNEGSLKIEKIL